MTDPLPTRILRSIMVVAMGGTYVITLIALLMFTVMMFVGGPIPNPSHTGAISFVNGHHYLCLVVIAGMSWYFIARLRSVRKRFSTFGRKGKLAATPNT